MANPIARRLRKTMTRQEMKLWVRQSPREGYIVDFVCMRHRLVVEVDGGQHSFDAHAAKDAGRDGNLRDSGFRVLRFWNNEIDRNFDGVLTTIDEAPRGTTPPSGPADRHPPPAGEG
jgi:very-short-patch-repair endonuclease